MRAGVIAIVAGSLLLLAGAGSSTLLFDAMGDFITDHFPESGSVVGWLLKGISFLAGAGGLAIIVGGVLMLLGFEAIGRLVTVIAATCALVGFIALVVVLVDRGEGDAGWWVDLTLFITGLGILLAFWAKPTHA